MALSGDSLSGRWRVAAVLWGFAEATLFFIVPDVLITALALRELRRGLEATAFVLAGALGGGAVMWWWGASDLPSIRTVLDHVPAISIGLMDRVAADLHSVGLASLFVGPFVGVPYKLYAAHAAAAGIGLPVFLAASLPARALRFVLLAVVAAVGARWARSRGWTQQTLIAIWLAAWVVNYAIYWSAMPN